MFRWPSDSQHWHCLAKGCLLFHAIRIVMPQWQRTLAGQHCLTAGGSSSEEVLKCLAMLLRFAESKLMPVLSLHDMQHALQYKVTYLQ